MKAKSQIPEKQPTGLRIVLFELQKLLEAILGRLDYLKNRKIDRTHCPYLQQEPSPLLTWSTPPIYPMTLEPEPVASFGMRSRPKARNMC